MLIFVGTGIWDEKDISLRGIEAARMADEVYVEFYTSKPNTSVEKLKMLLRRDVFLLDRSDLEENSRKIVERAMTKDVVILVPGDPMIATTHSAIRVQARKMGVETKIIHSSSIISGVCGITGLHNYRFGRSATISYPFRGRISRTPLETIENNWKIDAHTLLFLDLHPEPMKINQAISLLEELDNSILKCYGVGVARAGSADADVRCNTLKELKKYDFGLPMHILVVLSKKIHITEFEYLREFACAPDDLRNFVE
jgi:diphthine synthase